MAKIESEQLHLPRAKLITTTSMSNTNVVEAARRAFNTGKTRPLAFRKHQLKNLLKFLQDNETIILEALHRDLRKPRQESVIYELKYLENETRHLLFHLDEWAKPQKPTKPMVNLFDGVYVYSEPYGVVLVMGAWNYPLQLTLCPVIGAIAAGNCVVIKPSDLSPATSRLIADLLPRYLDSECFPVYLGGVEETTKLLKEKFDYIFYTGSTMVGKIIHQAATKHLTPTTLELGGKSPAYIDHTADIAKTVKRILWGKCMNSGQTCIAPDYILCSRQVQQKFVQYAQKALREFYGEDVRESPDMARIVNERHFHRLTALLAGLKIAIGGRYDVGELFIEPTIAVDVDPNHPIMQEEIFGPILPIIPTETVEDAIEFINNREKPLAFYIFTTNKRHRDLLLERVSSGGVTVNDTLLHVAVDCLPFGGVGNSGMGAYHGKDSFDIFSHKKSVLVKDFNAIAEKVLASRYPPYTEAKTAFISHSLKQRKRVKLIKYLPHFFMFLLGILLTVGVYFIVQAIRE